MVTITKNFRPHKANRKPKVFLTGNYRVSNSTREVEIRSVDNGQKCFVTLDLLEAYNIVASEKAKVIPITKGD